MIEILEGFGAFKRALNRLAMRELKPLGLGQKQAAFLRYLRIHRDCSHADLARHTATDPAAVGRIVDTLVAHKLVVRMPHPTDRRTWLLALSPKGRKVTRKVDEVVVRIAAELASPLNPAERNILVAIFRKVASPRRAVSAGEGPGGGRSEAPSRLQPPLRGSRGNE